MDGVSNPWLVGGAFTCTPDYVIRQGDIDAGEVVNTVTVSYTHLTLPTTPYV